MRELLLRLSKCMCDYRCIFCLKGTASYQDALNFELKGFDYKQEFVQIQRIIWSGYFLHHFKALEIGDNEPLNHPFILSIAALARKTGFREISMQTTGLKFADASFTKHIVKAGLTGVMIPVYGASSRVHDRAVRLEGSYQRLKKGLKNLEQQHVDIQLKTLVLKQNLKELPRLAARFKSIKIDFPFPPSRSLQDYARICVRLSDVPKALRRKVMLYIPCYNGKCLKSVFNGQRCNLEAGELQVHKTDYEFKAKPAKCRRCKKHNQCEGIYPLYLELYGDSEFNPIS